MKKLTVIILLTSLSIFGQQDSIFSITGKLKLAIEKEMFASSNTLIELFPTSKGAMTDSLGNFKFDAVRKGVYELRILEYEQVSKPYILEVKDESIINIELVVQVNCRLNSQVAKSDIEKGEPKLLLIGGIAPVYYRGQEKIEKKYGFQYYEFGCTPPPEQCVLIYNKIVFKYLDEKFGQKWRKDIRQDVIGLNYRTY